MRPSICVHPMLHFRRVHLTFKLFHGSKFNSCCQDCLLWAGYNWQHLFSFLPNKIICIFPAEEKRCGYSLGTADCLAHKAYLGSASQEKPSITTHVKTKQQKKQNKKKKRLYLPWHSVIKRGICLFITEALNYLTLLYLLCLSFTVP